MKSSFSFLSPVSKKIGFVFLLGAGLLLGKTHLAIGDGGGGGGGGHPRYYCDFYMDENTGEDTAACYRSSDSSRLTMGQTNSSNQGVIESDRQSDEGAVYMNPPIDLLCVGEPLLLPPNYNGNLMTVEYPELYCNTVLGSTFCLDSLENTTGIVCSEFL